MKKRILYTIIPIIMIIFGAVSHTASACPNCKKGYSETTAQAKVGEAYSMTIYGMILLPAMIVAFIGTTIYRQAKKAQSEKQ